MSRLDFVAIAEKTMHDLAGELGISVWLTVWDKNGPALVAKVESRNNHLFEVKIGTILRLTTSATGLVFLAYPATEETLALAVREREIYGKSIPNDAKLRKICVQVKKDGVSVKLQSDVIPGFSAIAAPVFDHTSRLRQVRKA